MDYQDIPHNPDGSIDFDSIDYEALSAKIEEKIEYVRTLLVYDLAGYERLLLEKSNFSLGTGVLGLSRAAVAGTQIKYYEALYILEDRVRDARRRVYEQMSIPDDCLQYLHGTQVYFATTGPNNQVVGFLETHPLAEAFNYLRDYEYLDGGIDIANPIPVQCGISVLWVQQHHRRRGIGTHLLRIAKRRMQNGALKWSDMAFAHIDSDSKRFCVSFYRKVKHEDTEE